MKKRAKKKIIAPEYEDIIKAYQPRGYELETRHMKSVLGLTHNLRKIVVPPIKTRDALFVYLHECGHVASEHMHLKKEKIPDYVAEYEADQYALDAFAELGLKVPVRTAARHRSVLRDYIETYVRNKKKLIPEREILEYAYGSRWRKYYAG